MTVKASWFGLYSDGETRRILIGNNDVGDKVVLQGPWEPFSRDQR
jgi:hypothetical protein